MEVDAIAEMFARSNELYSVQYIRYVGDGDCKTYNGVVASKPYGDTNIEKRNAFPTFRNEWALACGMRKRTTKV